MDSAPCTSLAKGTSTGRRRALTVVLLLVGLIVSGGIAYWLQKQQPMYAAPNGGLLIDANQLDFGEAWENKAFVWELTLHNPTTSEINVLKILSSCTCQKVEPESVVLPPGGTKKVRLTLDLTNAEQPQQPDSVHDFEQRLVPLIAGAPPRQQGWTLKGRVRILLAASPQTVRFGTRLVRGMPFSAEAVKIKKHPQVTGAFAESDPLLSVTIGPSPGISEEYELKIVPQAKAPPGPFRFDVLVKPTNAKGEALPPLVIPVEGVVLQDVQAQPNIVVFGMKPIANEVKETITLRSASGKPFDVLGVGCASADIQVLPLTTNSSVVRTYEIIQRVAREGHQSAIIRFAVRVPGEPESMEVTVQVAYRGFKDASPASGQQ
jgi:hypothetical protein